MTHYLRTFEHLAPTENVAPPHRRRRWIWIALPLLGVLALIMVRRPEPDPPPTPEATRRGAAPRIALAPSDPQPSAILPEVRVVERQGPKLIERMLAEKFGTSLAKAPARQPEPPTVVAAKPATPPPVADRPQLSEKPQVVEKPPVERPEVIAHAPARLTAPLATPRPAATPPPAPVIVTKAPAREPEPPAAKPQVAAKPAPAEPKPARVQEQPVAVARAERAQPVQAERIVVAEKPIAVVERIVPAPVAAQSVVVASTPRTDSAPLEAERVAVAVRAPAPRSSGPSPDAVRNLLDRYAAAWRGHDVDTLRAIGQVTNDGQANALRQYFANVGNLEVEVRVLDIRSEGDRATVRFTRRDTFRDPTGREIAKESPPIEKHVVTTPQGLRFAPAS